ncbi:hypothetical protein ABIB40_002467 [Pedobacter sp. UYP30]
MFLNLIMCKPSVKGTLKSLKTVSEKKIFTKILKRLSSIGISFRQIQLITNESI